MTTNNNTNKLQEQSLLTMKTIIMKDDIEIKKNQLVYLVELNDVLLGRGSPIVNNKGNIKFRKVINSRKDEYKKSNHHDIKNRIANEVIEIIMAKNGGRFLRKLEDPKEAISYGILSDIESTSVWVIVDEYVILQKVKQALREQGGLKKLLVSNQCRKKQQMKSNISKEDDHLSNVTPPKDVATSCVLSTSTNSSTTPNRITYEDILLTSARQELEKQTIIKELLTRGQLQIDNNVVHPIFAMARPPPRSSNIRIVSSDDTSYYRGNNNTPSSLVLSQQMVEDNNNFVELLQRQRYQDTISDLLKNKQQMNDIITLNHHNMNVNDLLCYGYQQKQRRQHTTDTSVVYDQVTSMDMELLVLNKKREMYNMMLNANHGGIMKRRKTDAF